MRKLLLSVIAFMFLSAPTLAFKQSNTNDHQPLTMALYKTGIKIIDIRTKPEWEQTGIVKGSYTITFFDEKGDYDANKFIRSISEIVHPSEGFAIICRSGNRTTAVAKFLRDVGYKKVINLKGGVRKAAKNGVPFEAYPKR